MASLTKSQMVIGISGGSCAGKTTFAEELHKSLGPDQSVILCQDWYYYDLSEKLKQNIDQVNFDHPESIDFKLMHQHIMMLLKGHPIAAPIYNFIHHVRLPGYKTVLPKKILILDGTLIFSQWMIRELLNYSVFLDIDVGLRIRRRINRDVRERGRTKESVLHQFESQVQPMHLKFVEPYKKMSSHIVTDDKSFFQLISTFRKLLSIL